ncbi:AP-4 complex subunit epsilon [Prunus yedoensis var. nudiflora]|uniref:AP-4 complex subunit epsilon n=1 Tax=Prunus yedoensis var. nudiflora TaxID=2094558 RepID=A0A314UJH7_PRUYE|nr:AP-4 complex subunit epsilon [Prunus yedoensis var. nudiflora]
MTHDDNLLLKCTGYLAVSLFLSDDHDLIILIVNTIQKDLKSDNYLVACAALNAVCKLINDETVPAVLPQVVDLLAHPREAVRKKAIMASPLFQNSRLRFRIWSRISRSGFVITIGEFGCHGLPLLIPLPSM